MRELLISKNDADLRLDKFLSKALPNLPKSLCYKYIRTKRIKVNNGRAEISTRLRKGDLVQLYISEEFFSGSEEKYDFLSASLDLDIVYEDNNILVANKPAGLLSHPDRGEYLNSLIIRIQRYLYEKREYDPEGSLTFAPALVNRLDRNTVGLLIAAKNAETLRHLNEKTKKREIIKGYLCVVHGTPQKKSDSLYGFLYKDSAKNKVFLKAQMLEGGLEIHTKYQVLAEKSKSSLLEVELLTGRPHQIRAHLASIGHPILGDYKYTSKEQRGQFGYRQQLLCAYKLKFDFKEKGGSLDYLKGREIKLDNVWFLNDFYSSDKF